MRNSYKKCRFSSEIRPKMRFSDRPSVRKSVRASFSLRAAPRRARTDFVPDGGGSPCFSRILIGTFIISKKIAELHENGVANFASAARARRGEKTLCAARNPAVVRHQLRSPVLNFRSPDTLSAPPTSETLRTLVYVARRLPFQRRRGTAGLRPIRGSLWRSFGPRTSVGRLHGDVRRGFLLSRSSRSNAPI